MATETTPHNTKRVDQLHHIYPLTPVRLGPFRISPKYVIGGSLFAFCFVVDFLTLLLAKQAWPATLLINISAILFYAILLHRQTFEGNKPRLAKLFRMANKKQKRLRGLTVYVPDQPEISEFFGAYDPDALPPPKIDLIGELHFAAQPLDDEDPDNNMGVLEDVSYEIASATARVHWSSVLTADESTATQRLVAYANMLAAMSAEADETRWFKWRDTTFLSEAIDPKGILDEVRASSRIQAAPSPAADELFVRRSLEQAEQSWYHRSTLTLATYMPDIADHIKTHGGVGEVLLDRMEAFGEAVFPDPEAGKISPVGIRAATLLTRRDLILDNRASVDPVFGQPLLEMGVSRKGGPYLDDYDAYPYFACFDEEEYPEWKGCIKVGHTYWYGLCFNHLTQVGLTSRKWAELLNVKIKRTVVVTNEPMPEKVAKRRTRASTAGRTKESLHPSDRVEFERAAQIEDDLANNRGQGGKLRAIFGMYGATPDETRAGVSRLMNVASKNGIVLVPLTNRQDKTINAVMSTARDLRKPDIPLGLQLLGSKQ
jgi:hypothetical protein